MEDTPRDSEPVAAKPYLLIVAEDRLLGDLLTEALTSLDYTVRSERTVLGGLFAIDVRRPDLVLLQIRTEGRSMSCEDFTAILRHHAIDIPVLDIGETGQGEPPSPLVLDQILGEISDALRRAGISPDRARGRRDSA